MKPSVESRAALGDKVNLRFVESSGTDECLHCIINLTYDFLKYLAAMNYTDPKTYKWRISQKNLAEPGAQRILIPHALLSPPKSMSIQISTLQPEAL